MLKLFYLISTLRISRREAEDNNPGGDIQGATRALRNPPAMLGGRCSINPDSGRLTVKMCKELFHRDSGHTTVVWSNG